MPFARPTLQEIVDRIISDFNTRITNSDTFLRRSVLRIMARVYAGAIHLVYGFLEFTKDQIFAATADVEHLDRLGGEYGVTRNAAVKATGSATITGTVGSTVPAGTELESGDGNLYVVDTAVTLIATSGTIDVTASVANDNSNEAAGVTLTFVSPIAGIDTTATVTSGGLEGGADEESDDAYKERVLTRKRQAPHGGADFDYTSWMREVSGVTRSWTISQYQGPGTLGAAFVYDDEDDIFPSDSERDDMVTYLTSHTDPGTGETVGMPVTALPGLFVLDIGPKTINMEISIYPNTTAVRAAARTRLESLFVESGGPEQTIYLSDMTAAISSAAGEERHSITSPTTDQTSTALEVHVLGDIVWSTYNG
jgi:uncharacterized phage protein gp47/JayE